VLDHRDVFPLMLGLDSITCFRPPSHYPLIICKLKDETPVPHQDSSPTSPLPSMRGGGSNVCPLIADHTI